MAKNKVTSADLMVMLQARHPAPKWALFSQVRNSTGFSAKPRTADALAMGLWPSIGLYLHGFEIKVSRSDWLREIQDPAKADAIGKHCHYWWIVATPKVVKIEELPASWGLLEPVGNGLRVKSAADKRDPELASWEFLASLMRQVHESSASKEQLEKEYRRGITQGENQIDHRAKYAMRQLEHLQETVTAFEKSSGLKIHHWTAGDIGKAVKALMQIAPEDYAEELASRASRLEESAAVFRDAAEQVRSLSERKEVA